MIIVIIIITTHSSVIQMYLTKNPHTYTQYFYIFYLTALNDITKSEHMLDVVHSIYFAVSSLNKMYRYISPDYPSN